MLYEMRVYEAMPGKMGALGRRFAFGADSEWQTARAESERDRPLVANVHNELWRPTAYSPLQ